jgi:mRNA interferase MazF
VKEGEVILASLPQADGARKLRPALLLRILPPFGDYLACGVSTQLHQAIPGFDEVLRNEHPDFVDSGLLANSVIRLGFLAVLTSQRIVGSIGHISPDRHARLLRRLSQHLVADLDVSANNRMEGDPSGRADDRAAY